MIRTIYFLKVFLLIGDLLNLEHWLVIYYNKFLLKIIFILFIIIKVLIVLSYLRNSKIWWCKIRFLEWVLWYLPWQRRKVIAHNSVPQIRIIFILRGNDWSWVVHVAFNYWLINWWILYTLMVSASEFLSIFNCSTSITFSKIVALFVKWLL
jgi:hypothetical protein